MGATGAWAQNTYTVTNRNDNGAGSLRQAITDSNANPPGSGANTISFSVATGTITLTSSLPTITANVTIPGPGAKLLTVSGNHDANVGSIFNVGPGMTMNISGLTIANGNADGDASSTGAGGAIYVDHQGTLTVTNCAFSGNSADSGSGGAIYDYMGTVTVTNSTFSGNSSNDGGSGGGIFNAGTLTVTNSTFSGNSADTQGGGIAAGINHTVTVTNSTFSGNSATNGGGISNGRYTRLTVTNSIFTGNSATNGGGISNASGTITVNYSILTGDAGGECGGSGCPTNGSGGNVVGAGNINLLPLGNYGGPTETMLPAAGSAAICAGSFASVPSGVTTDQRGFPLSAANCANSGVDAGAVQTNYQTVTTLADNTNASPDCAIGTGSACSLRDAIGLSNSSGGDITFAQPLFLSGTPPVATPGTITLGTGNGGRNPLPAITGQVNLVGPGANLLTVSGNNDSNVGSVFAVNSGATASLYGLTIAKGNATMGGGILINTGGTLTVMASDVSSSTADQGGGIFNSGILTLTASTVSGNTASEAAPLGGGIDNNAGTLTVINSTVSGNSAYSDALMSSSWGGGIYNRATLTLTDSTVSGNSAYASPGFPQGGGIYNDSALSLANSVVAGNSLIGPAAHFADIYGSYTDNGGNLGDNSSSPTSTYQTILQLSPLQYNGIGATVRTMIPLPGSPAICAGTTTPAGGLALPATDARGFPMDPGCSSGTVDAGAVQTNYTAIVWAQQPTNTAVNVAISPAPVVEVQETNAGTGATDGVSGIPVAISFSGAGTLGGGQLTGTTGPTMVGTNPVNGAVFTGLAPDTAGSGYTLSTVPIQVTTSGPGITLAALASNTFYVYGVATQLSVSATSPVTAGNASSVTVTALDANGNPVLNGTGSVNLTITGQSTTLATVALGGGTGSGSVTLTAAGTVTVKATDASNSLVTGVSNQITVATAAPAVLAAGAGTPQSAYVNTAFATPLTVTVTDAYGNPVSGVTVNFSTPASGAFAVLSASSCATDATGSCSVTATANWTAGSYTVTAAVSGVSAGVSFSLTNNPPPNLVVTSTGDDAGTASNCTVQTSTSTGTDASCSLRDVLLEAANLGTANIWFDAGKFAAPTTIGLTGGTLNIPSYTTITGPTAGSGATPTNLVTVSGGGSSSNFSVFTVSAGVTGAAIANLTITNGYSSTFGGGIYNLGILLTVTNSTFSGNSAANGGGIANVGMLVVTNCTFSGNSSPNGDGGGILNGATLMVTNSTFSGNSAAHGAGILNGGTLALANSIVSGNWLGTASTVTGYDDLFDFRANTVFPGSASDKGGNLVGYYNNPQAAPPTPAAHLAPLGNYGGPMQTMIPLPGSPAICAGLAANIPSGVTTDQRGYPNTNTAYSGYSSSSPCVDAGAVQTNYSLKWAQPPSTVVQNAAMSPAPQVELDESGVPFFDGSHTIPIPLSLTTGSGTLTGGSASTAATTGIAAYSALSIDRPGTSDVLTASLALNPAASPAPSIALAGSSFDVDSAVTQLAFATAPTATVTAGGNAGTTIMVHEEDVSGTLVTTAGDTVTLTVTGPNSSVKTYTATASSGVATFNLSGAALTAAGAYSYTASIGGSVTNATASETVSAAAAASVSAVSGSSQSAAIGSAYAQPLKVLVEDQYSNPVQGAAVVFTGPASGASATFSTPALTAADGTTGAIATANGTASATGYAVTASVSGASTSSSFSLTNTQAATTLTVTPDATGIVYGQPETMPAAIAPGSIAGSSPSGSVTFYEGVTALMPASTVAGAAASYTVGVPTVGAHNYSARYSGDGNFQQSTLTPAASAVVVGKASSTLTGPGSTVSLTYSAGGAIPISIAGQFSGVGIATPSGSVTYTIGSGTLQTAAIASGAATLAVPATQAAGSYTVTVSYSGDGNYNAAVSIEVSLSIAPATLVLTANNATRVYGTANPAFTGTVTGAVNGDTYTESFSTTATAASPVGTYAIVPGVTGANLSDYAQSVTDGTLTVTQAATTTALSVSGASITPGQSVTLAATVASATTGTPDGTVSFYDGTTLLGTSALSAGAAIYSSAALAPGLTHTITATYSGDANFAGSSSTASTTTIIVAPLDFTMTIAGPSSQTVVPGSSITYQVTMTPMYGSYAGTVNFAVSGLPPGATVTLSPSSIAANGGPQTITVTITTAPATAAMHRGAPPGRRFAPFALAFFVLFGAGALRRRGRALQRMLGVAILVAAGAAATLATGCGGGFFAQAPQSYSVTVSATAGNLQRTTTFTLNVQ